MKRTTILLPDELAALLDRERRRRDVSAATVVREALEAFLVGERTTRRHIPFAAIGASGGEESIAANAEEILAREWAAWIEQDSGLQSPAMSVGPGSMAGNAGSESAAES